MEYAAGRIVFYDVDNGQILIIVPSMKGMAKPKTPEEYIANYSILKDRERSSFDYIQLEYGQYDQDFFESSSQMVDSETKELKFYFPDSDDGETEIQPQKPLTEQIKDLSQRQDLMQKALDDVILGGTL